MIALGSGCGRNLGVGGVVTPAVDEEEDAAGVRLMKAGIAVIVGGVAALLFELVQLAAVLLLFGFGFLVLGLLA